MRRKALTLLASLSLLLCAAALLDPWARRGWLDWFGVMTWRTDDAGRTMTELSLTTRHGVAIFSWDTVESDVAGERPPAWRFEHGTVADTDRDFRIGVSLLERAGFGFRANRVTTNLVQHTHWALFRNLIVPTWFLAIVLLIFPAAQFRAWRRRRYRLAGGLCTKCGYDLRATSIRCPECGEAANKRVTPASA
jgi:hypothetical protein